MKDFLWSKKLRNVSLAIFLMLGVVTLAIYTHPSRGAVSQTTTQVGTDSTGLTFNFDHVITYKTNGDTIKFDNHGPCKVGPTVIHYDQGVLDIQIGESPVMVYKQDSVQYNTLFTTGQNGKQANFTRFNHDSVIVAQEQPYLLIFSKGYKQGCKTIQDIIN